MMCRCPVFPPTSVSLSWSPQPASAQSVEGRGLFLAQGCWSSDWGLAGARRWEPRGWEPRLVCFSSSGPAQCGSWLSCIWGGEFTSRGAAEGYRGLLALMGVWGLHMDLLDLVFLVLGMKSRTAVQSHKGQICPARDTL